MSVTASTLSKRCGEADVSRIIREQLDMIDALLNGSTKVIGRNSISVSLPVVFPEIAATNKEIVKTIVYAGILKSLEDRGFDVHIEICCDFERVVKKVKLVIEWIAQMDREEVEKLQEYIKGKTRLRSI